MKPDHPARGGAPVAVLDRMEPWEADLLLNLRLWCDGPAGRRRVLAGYRGAMPDPEAHRAFETFEVLLNTIVSSAYRPLVHHCVACRYAGADECVFLTLVRMASDGHLNDAALIATLLIGPAQAELVALLAGHVGDGLRHRPAEPSEPSSQAAHQAVRLH